MHSLYPLEPAAIKGWFQNRWGAEISHKRVDVDTRDYSIRTNSNNRLIKILSFANADCWTADIDLNKQSNTFRIIKYSVNSYKIAITKGEFLGLTAMCKYQVLPDVTPRDSLPVDTS